MGKEWMGMEEGEFKAQHFFIAMNAKVDGSGGGENLNPKV